MTPASRRRETKSEYVAVFTTWSTKHGQRLNPMRLYKGQYCCLFITTVFLLLILGTPACGAEGFTQYTDPEKRFIFDYPSSMKVDVPNKNEVLISHPGASLRIAVFVENRQTKGPANADLFLEAFKKNLKDEMKEGALLEQGKSPSLQGSQGYVVCSFKNHKGTQVIQLVQYYVTEDRVLQMTIADKPAGFKNLEKVIHRIHYSLRVVNPQLK
jgi:hypothetical protein